MSQEERRSGPARLQFGGGTSRGKNEPGDGPIGVGSGRDGVLYVPDTVEANAPVMVFLHGAGGSGRREQRVWLAAADRFGVVVVAPDSQGPTWDVLMGGFGPDVAHIDRCLDAVAERCDVDLSRIALAGVSDGASYALSVGLANGDVFPWVVAFSPGFIMTPHPEGEPRIYVSHGTKDPVLPIDGCSRTLVPALQSSGYDVSYEEFDGGHTVPPPVADRAFAWWLASRVP